MSNTPQTVEEALDLDLIRDYITESSPQTSIYIGCDSVRHKDRGGNWVASYSLVVVVHKDTKKGCKLFGSIIKIPDYGNLRQRLMQEVYYVSELGLALVDSIGERKFEIHIDVNPSENFASSTVIKEACGYIRAMFNMDPKTKPEASAASTAADMWSTKFGGRRHKKKEPRTRRSRFIDRVKKRKDKVASS